MSDSVSPHRRQPTRLPRPWDSPGKNTGVGCRFLLQCMKVKMKWKSLSCVPLFATPWTAAYQAPPSMGFSRQEYWSGVPLPSPFLSLGFSNFNLRLLIQEIVNFIGPDPYSVNCHDMVNLHNMINLHQVDQISKKSIFC